MKDQWLYLSYSLSPETPAYGGGQCFSSNKTKSMHRGDSCNASSWTMSSHSGTHIDFPLHFSDQGSSLDVYGADFFFFNHIYFVDMGCADPSSSIGFDTFQNHDIPSDTELILIKTGFCQLRNKAVYWQENPWIDPDLADFFRKKLPELKVIGIDSISISSILHRTLGRQAHKAFLDHQRPILLLEDMDLNLLGPGVMIKQVVVAPLRVDGADGSPCTVLAHMSYL